MTSWHECLSTLDQLANLERGWNGPESKAPQPGQITAAWRFLRCMQLIRADFPKAVTLSDDGTVIIEWWDHFIRFRLETITASLFEVTLVKMGECADYFQVQSK